MRCAETKTSDTFWHGMSKAQPTLPKDTLEPAADLAYAWQPADQAQPT
jgi:hypothetical protein